MVSESSEAGRHGSQLKVVTIYANYTQSQSLCRPGFKPCLGQAWSRHNHGRVTIRDHDPVNSNSDVSCRANLRLDAQAPRCS